MEEQTATQDWLTVAKEAARLAPTKPNAALSKYLELAEMIESLEGEALDRALVILHEALNWFKAFHPELLVGIYNKAKETC